MTTPDSPVAPTVILVDDDDDLRHVLRLVFEVEDFDVVGEAANGVEAVTLAMRHRPDFAILDYRMPRLDGEGTAEILRAVSPETRIVAFSAVLEQKPEWADAFLNKTHIADVIPLLDALLARGFGAPAPEAV